MSYSADRYAYYIVHRMLRLEEGEGLTLNANPETIEFAHKVAHEAAETTGCTVSLVYIENGTPQSVDEIEPSFKPHKALRPVMLHLASFSQAPFNPDEESDARTLQKHRLLADPVFLDRRISIPYAVAYVPTPLWAEFVYGPGATADRLFLDLASFMGFEDENEGEDSTKQLERILSMRSAELNRMKIKALHLTGPQCDLTVRTAQGSACGTSAVRLDGGRFFYPSLPCEDIIIPVNRDSADGWFRTTLPFRLYDRVFSDARITLENGRITAFTGADAGYVGKYLNVDPLASHISEVILCESLTRAAMSELSFGIPLLDRMRASQIAFGGITPERVTLQDESLLDSCGLNTSFARLELPVGSTELTVSALTEDGNEKVIMEDGRFSLEV